MDDAVETSVTIPPAATNPPDRWAHRRGEPRTFAALWLLFLFAAALISLGAGGAMGLMATDVYRASARVLLVLAGVGIGVLWPMVRLSQEAPERPFQSVLQDVVIVGTPLQALAWPQVLPWMASWPVGIAGAIAAHFAAWVILIGGLLACFFQLLRWKPRLPRWIMMAMLMLTALAAPAANLLESGEDVRNRPSPGSTLWLMASPVTGGWEVVRDRAWTGLPAKVESEKWKVIVAVGAAGGVLWVVAAAIAGPGESRRGGGVRHDAPAV